MSGTSASFDLRPLVGNWGHLAPFSEANPATSPIGVDERRNAIHLARAEGLTVVTAEQQFFVSDPKSARMLPAQKLASDAALLFTQFFSRLSDEGDADMLEQCFVETSESKKADAELQKMTQNLINTIRQLDTAEVAALQ